jgi:hypothetical protein
MSRKEIARLANPTADAFRLALLAAFADIDVQRFVARREREFQLACAQRAQQLRRAGRKAVR